MAKNISKKFSFVGENIRRIRQAKSISQAEFASLFELGRAAVGAYEEGRSEPKIDTIIQLAKFFSISIDDLLTKQLTVAEIYSMDRVNKKLDKVHGRKEDAKNHDKIPLVRRDDFIDYVIRHKDQSFLKSLEQVAAPVHSEVIRVFEMKGHEMENQGQGIKTGDFLFCEKLNWKKLKQFTGSVVLVVSSSDVFCRRLEAAKAGKATFSADSKSIEPLEMTEADIQEIWNVKGVYTSSLNPPSQLEDRIGQLEAMLNRLGSS